MRARAALGRDLQAGGLEVLRFGMPLLSSPPPGPCATPVPTRTAQVRRALLCGPLERRSCKKRLPRASPRAKQREPAPHSRSSPSTSSLSLSITAPRLEADPHPALRRRRARRHERQLRWPHLLLRGQARHRGVPPGMNGKREAGGGGPAAAHAPRFPPYPLSPSFSLTPARPSSPSFLSRSRSCP